MPYIMKRYAISCLWRPSLQGMREYIFHRYGKLRLSKIRSKEKPLTKCGSSKIRVIVTYVSSPRSPELCRKCSITIGRRIFLSHLSCTTYQDASVMKIHRQGDLGSSLNSEWNISVRSMKLPRKK